MDAGFHRRILLVAAPLRDVLRIADVSCGGSFVCHQRGTLLSGRGIAPLQGGQSCFIVARRDLGGSKLEHSGQGGNLAQTEIPSSTLEREIGRASCRERV